MRLHILGSGTPDPLKERYGSGFLLELDDPNQMIMVDCGPASTYKMACMEIAPSQVGHLFFTHHHFDHNADFPCLALTRWDQTTTAEKIPLKVYGPPPTATFVERLFGEEGAYVDDWKARVGHPVSGLMHTGRGGTLPRPEPRFEVREVGDGLVAETSSWKARSIPINHVEPWLQSVAYRFETAAGSILFSGDAGPCENLDTLCKGADVLVLCCAFLDSPNSNPLVGQVVTGSRDCARLAAASGAGVVVLTHSNRPASSPEGRQKILAEVSRQFSGTLIFGEEKTTVDLADLF